MSIKAEYLPEIEQVARILRPAPNTSREEQLIGTVEQLAGATTRPARGGSQRCTFNQPGCPSRPWTQRSALGGYLGAGAAYHFSFFALYARARAQAVIADGLPFTLWGSTQGGMQFRIARAVDLFSALGLAGFVTGEGERIAFSSYDVGVSIHFGVGRQRQGRRPAPPR